jgi:hypothetical protein
MIYYQIQYTDGSCLLQETYLGNVVRYCDTSGNTVTPPEQGSQNIGVVTPSFTPPPDPAPAQAPIDPLNVPLRTLTYDDKGRIIRIDYPTMGIYQLLEYMAGKLSKITEFSTAGVSSERHYHYNEWGQLFEETQL